MRNLAYKRITSNLGCCLALGMVALSSACAAEPATPAPSAAKAHAKSLSAFRREIIASLKPSINFAASDSYLSPQDYYGKSTDQKAAGVACPPVSSVIDSMTQRVGILKFARDYDTPNSDLDREDCATFLRSTPVTDFCKANPCGGIEQRPQREVMDVARYCVYVDPRQTRCDVTVISFGARWLVDTNPKWQSELKDANRNSLITETLTPVKETLRALPTAR